MRSRPSARVLVLDEEHRALLLKFTFRDGALAGNIFWATPGGALEEGESYEEGARRELFEETGINADALGEALTEREFTMVLPDGETVLAKEKIFLYRTNQKALNSDHQTVEEREIISTHKWWQASELESAFEKIYPEDLVQILKGLPRESTLQ